MRLLGQSGQARLTPRLSRGQKGHRSLVSFECHNIFELKIFWNNSFLSKIFRAIDVKIFRLFSIKISNFSKLSYFLELLKFSKFLVSSKIDSTALHVSDFIKIWIMKIRNRVYRDRRLSTRLREAWVRCLRVLPSFWSKLIRTVYPNFRKMGQAPLCKWVGGNQPYNPFWSCEIASEARRSTHEHTQRKLMRVSKSLKLNFGEI